MRFPEPLLAAILVLAAPAAFAGAEQVRSALATRLQATHPDLGPSELVLGPAAFDTALRDRPEWQSPAPGSAEVLAAGKAIWTRKFRNGRTLAQCFPNGGRRIAASYPQLDAKSRRVVTLETAVNQCLKSHGEALLDPADPATMGAVLAYLRSLSPGQKITVRPANALAEERFEQGRRLYFTRMGQQNHACATCHLQLAGRRYGDTPLPSAFGQAAGWPWLRGGKAVTLQMQARSCLERMGAAPFPAGSDELAQVEYFLTAISQGYALRPNGGRAALP